MLATTMAAKPETAPAATPAAPAGGKKSILIIVLACVLSSAVVGGGAAWFFGSKSAHAADSDSDEKGKKSKKADKDKDDEDAEIAKPAQYHALEPAFVVNLASAAGARYLQVEVQLMTRDEAAAKDLETHDPALRNALLLLLSQQDANTLIDRAGKEALQKAALEEINKVMKTETGKTSVESLLFTSFVTQ